MTARGRDVASLGVALIVKDGASTLGACLDSIRPYVRQIVVCVDELTTDKTAKVAKRHGADVVTSVKVSDWHECERHGRVLAQHFAKARNESFSKLDPNLEFWGWIDADDVLKGGEHLAMRLANVPEQYVGLWLPYHYATITNSNGEQITNTLFDRERILRSKVGWNWEQRVHEVVKPLNDGPWLSCKEVQVYHQEGGHRSQSSADRNQLLLEIDLEEDPNSTRAAFYLANGYFAKGDMPAAAHWYERLVEMPEASPYEVWQSYCYLSQAYQRQEDLDSAIKAAFGAIDTIPYHPEPYFLMGGIYLSAGEFEKAKYWTDEGRKKPEPPFFVFKNPLDYSYNNRTVMADAKVQLGDLPGALDELRAAHKVIPNQTLQNAIETYEGLAVAEDKARAFAALAELAQTDEQKIGLWDSLQLPPEVRQFGRVRDVVIPAMIRQRPNTQPRLVFWCGRALEEWYPGTLNTTGIGGSETAVVEIAKRFAADGWRVDVYNGAGRYEGIYDGVGYWDPERFDTDGGDVLVSWRQPGFATTASFNRSILWLHDLNYGPIPEHVLPGLWDSVVGVSQWHADMLKAYYGVDAGYVPNGIDLNRFAEPVEKVPFRCVYASSPDRGLDALLRLWPRIVKDEPTAELHVAYGWENTDKAIPGGRRDLAAYKAHIEGLIAKTPRVVWRGRLPQSELAKLYSESYLWLYPTNFLEVSCISAMEAMAGGAVPVTSSAGALKETIGSGVDVPGVVVPGAVHSPRWQDFYALTAAGMLHDRVGREYLAGRARERAQSFTWDAAYENHWKPLVAGLLSPKKELVAA